MSTTTNARTLEISIGGRVFTLSPMPLGVLEDVWPIIGELGDIADREKIRLDSGQGTRKQAMQSHTERMKLMRTLFAFALRSTYPEMTSEFIRDHMTAQEAHVMPGLYIELMVISGLLTPGEVQPPLNQEPAVEEANLTETSALSSPSASAEESVKGTGTESLAA